MSFFQRKQIQIPSGSTQQIEAVRSWSVRWKSRYTEFSDGFKDETEVFVDEELANNFADSLRQAFKLLRYKNGTEVKVEENK